jgi:hypothetical protein
MTEAFTPEQEQAMAEYRLLARPVGRELLLPHTYRDERMVLVRFDEDKPGEFDFPFQDPEAFLVEPEERLSVESGNINARRADSRFDDMISMAGEGSEAQEIIQEAGEIVENGGFVWISTAHIEDLTDIAYAGHITTNLLTELGEPEKAPKDVLAMLSMAISEGAYLMELEGFDEPQPIPMLGVVLSGFTKVIRTWPRTDTANEIVDKLPGFAVEWINANAVQATKDIVAKGHATGAMGSSGTTRTVDGAMSPVNGKTIDMLSLPNAYMLGMTVWRQSDKPVARYMGRPVKIDPERPGQVDDFFTRLTGDMNDHIPGSNFRYNRPDSR